MLQLFWPVGSLIVGGGLGFLVGFLVFRPKQPRLGHPQQAQFVQHPQWQGPPQQQWQQAPPQFPPQHGYGQQPRPPQ